MGSDKSAYYGTKSATNTMLILGIIFVAANLRPSITSVGPLINSIRADLGISNGLAGLITTLPLIAFAIISPLAPKIEHHIGNEWTILTGTFVLVAGILIRSTGSVLTLFIGTACIGLGIAVCNVLLPSLVKLKFPQHVGLMTSLYSSVMAVVAALASGVSIPLAEGLHFGWKIALALWAILSIVTILVWLPQLRFNNTNANVQKNTSSNSVWSSSIAWQVTFFMGLQSFLFYCIIAWLPAILIHDGISASTAGWMLSIMQFVGLPATFITPILADRLPNQRIIVLGIGVLGLIGITGFIFGGNIIQISLWTVFIGLSQGASFSLALVLLGLRASSAKQAGELSSMAQSIGYLLAAIGPVLIGVLFDFTHAWTVPLIILIITNLMMIVAGMGAGRNIYLYSSE